MPPRKPRKYLISHYLEIKIKMNEIVIIINILTNVFALVPAHNLYARGEYGGMIILLMSFVASCLMHMTETKHGLKPPMLERYSWWFLNLDRFLAFCVFGYVMYLWWTIFPAVSVNALIPIAVKFALGGGLALRIGERTDNLRLYLITHTIWHYCAFTAVNDVVNLL